MCHCDSVATKVNGHDSHGKVFKDMAWIPGGTFMMGSNVHYPEEAPAHQETVRGFWMDKNPVTNADFCRFVESTSYITLAERVPEAGNYPGALSHLLVPGSVVFKQPQRSVDLRNHYNWWDWVPGANWRHPEGPESTIEGRVDHPVVHVAFEDIEEYARWAGKELPDEAEWEFAARGGLEGAVYPWGNEFAPGGKLMANTWQGEFPIINLLLDGFAGTSPIGSYPPNGYGLYDMAGNVWEWTTSWFVPRGKMTSACCAGRAKGDDREKSYDPQTAKIKIPRKVLKGGSFLCAANYCLRYRPAARIPQQVDTGTCHQGFRCIVRRDGP